MAAGEAGGYDAYEHVYEIWLGAYTERGGMRWDGLWLTVDSEEWRTFRENKIKEETVINFFGDPITVWVAYARDLMPIFGETEKWVFKEKRLLAFRDPDKRLRRGENIWIKYSDDMLDFRKK